MLTRKNDSQMEFDLEKALEQSHDNPVFYVHYAHARCRSVLRSAAADFGASGITAEALGEADLGLLKDDAELTVIRIMAGWPRLVETGARLSGDGLPRLVQRATGVDWAALALEVQLGSRPQVQSTRAWYAGLEFVPLGLDGPRAPAAVARWGSDGLHAGEEAQMVLYPSELATTVSSGRKAGVVWACTASPARTAHLLDRFLRERAPQG